MKRLGKLLGKIIFWVSWPGLWFIFRWSRRTRLLLICGDEFLVLRGWLGSGLWGLPGGGLHHKEELMVGLLREVKEETGVILSPQQVTLAFDDYSAQQGLKFHYYAFVAQISQKPAVRPQPLEVAAWEWQVLKNPTLPLNQDTQAILTWWLNRA